eukprot:TRINITY_DN16402_c0_g1_i12.p1 TRINITY_DN16402_c0_g1~~TRINITY_DN16402_c0_g1_i12.p1  ORF type:complete len:235 (-),score=32.03 TRINITY_DN16402_c0_g1_i12:198-803(-)
MDSLSMASLTDLQSSLGMQEDENEPPPPPRTLTRSSTRLSLASMRPPPSPGQHSPSMPRADTRLQSINPLLMESPTGSWVPLVTPDPTQTQTTAFPFSPLAPAHTPTSRLTRFAPHRSNSIMAAPSPVTRDLVAFSFANGIPEENTKNVIKPEPLETQAPTPTPNEEDDTESPEVSEVRPASSVWHQAAQRSGRKKRKDKK